MKDDPRAIELGIDADEEGLGVTEGLLLSWDWATICVFVLEDGTNVVGFAVSPPHREHDPQIGQHLARCRAMESARRVKDRIAERAARGANGHSGFERVVRPRHGFSPPAVKFGVSGA